MAGFDDCQFREIQGNTSALFASPLMRGERTEVRGFWNLKRILTLPLSLTLTGAGASVSPKRREKGRGHPIGGRSIQPMEPCELILAQHCLHRSTRLNFLQ